MSAANFTRRRPSTDQRGSGRLGWRGWTVRGSRGETIGNIEEIYVAEETATPDWALVRSDGPGATTSFLPLQGSTSEGNEVIVPFTRAQVTHAPYTEETNRLSPEQGAALYDYYGISDINPSTSEARRDSAWEKVVATEHKLTTDLSRAWQQWRSNMRGHNNAAPAADKGPRSTQAKQRQGERNEDAKQR